MTTTQIIFFVTPYFEVEKVYTKIAYLNEKYDFNLSKVLLGADSI